MKKLTEFIVKNITGSEDFEVDEVTEGDRVTLFINASPDIVGLIIGKEGKTIKNIRRIVSVKATLLKKALDISVSESQA